MLAEQQDRLTRETSALNKDIASLTAKRDALVEEIAEAQSILTLAQNDLKKTVKRQENAENAVATAKQELKNVYKQQEAAESAVARAENELLSIEQRVSAKLEDDQSLTRQVETKKSELSKAKTALKVFTVKSKDKIDELEKAIKSAELRLAVVLQEIDEQVRLDATTRKELANRQIELDKREENLRLREQKVEQGEDKLIRHSNLLNL